MVERVYVSSVEFIREFEDGKSCAPEAPLGTALGVAGMDAQNFFWRMDKILGRKPLGARSEPGCSLFFDSYSTAHHSVSRLHPGYDGLTVIESVQGVLMSLVRLGLS